MPKFVKSSFLEEFELPSVSHETLKSEIAKIKTTHTVSAKNKSISNLSLEERLRLIEEEVYKTLGRYKGFVEVIYDIDTLNKYIDKAISVDYLAFDTETNNSLDPLTCKLMGLCLYIPNTKPVYVPINHCEPGTDILLKDQVTEEQARDALMRLKNTRIIYHNGKFDIRVIYNTLGFYLPIWWDTMLAAQLLDENERAALKFQFKNHVDPTIEYYNIEKLFTGIPYAWVNPEVFALYAAIDAYDTYKLQQYQEKIFNEDDMTRLYNLFRNIEVPVTSIVAKMEDTGISIDLDFVNKLNDKYHRGLDKALDNLNSLLEPYRYKIEHYQEKGELDNPLNFNSPPQLQIILYDILGAPMKDGEKPTDKNTLKSLGTPFTKTLLDYRHYAKLISAFTEALPQLASKKDGKIHASFNQMGKEENNVVTGRFSSSDPNLQQIPSHERVMRLMFKASPGYVIIGGDYSQQEPRLLTHMCKDEKLIETYNNKKDLYATIGSMVFKKSYWECMEHWEDGSANPEGKEIRSKCKSLVLGIMYGMGAKLMATLLKVSVDECKEILEEFYKMFPTIKDFTLSNENMAKELGYVEDYMGRRRHLPDINLPEIEFKAHQTIPINSEIFIDDINDTLTIDDKELSERWNKDYIEDKTYAFKKKAKFKELIKGTNVQMMDNGAFISKATTQCTNARIQGGAASLTKKAMVNIYKNKELMDLGFRILVPVHDELLGECPIENAERVSELLSQTMIDAAKPECSVSMKVDTYCVKHWYIDEVSYSVRDEYLKLLKGDSKKNILPITESEALSKMVEKYAELNSSVVEKMCRNTFDCARDSL